jgi:aminoglycoside phosphotransferase family enzyme
MSWVVLGTDRVLKLKKPVRQPFLDFTTLAAREFDCREEVRLNARLAPGVYRGVLALQWHAGGLALVEAERVSAPAQTVDWVVLMRRLPERRMLSRLVAEGRVEAADIDALIAVLGAFYRHAARVPVSGDELVARMRRELDIDRETLLRPAFALNDAAGVLDRTLAALARHAGAIAERCARGRIVDGHGDLRPEHVCLIEPPAIIDCLEFDPRLRQVDPFDELAFLGLECELAGAVWIGPRLVAGCAAALGEDPPDALIRLYTAQRALLRARLAAAHLLDAAPRLPAKWLPQARRYLAHAERALDALECA